MSIASVLQQFRLAMSERPRLIAWSRAAVSAHASRLVAQLLLAFGVLALVGWAADLWWLVQPFRSLPPLRLGSAIGLTTLGVGILTVSAARLRFVSQVSAWSTIVLGSLPLQHATGFDGLWNVLARVTPPSGVVWHGTVPGQVALSSGAFLVLGGIGLLSILSRQRGLWPSIVLAGAGGTVMLLATTVIAGQLLGFLEGVKYGPLLGSSLQSTVCAIVFATHFNAMAWSKKTGFAPPPAWLPLSVGAGSLVTVLFVWRALLHSEGLQLQERSRVAAKANRVAIGRELRVTQRTLQRMARYSSSPDTMWLAFVTQMVQDVSGLQSVLWLDSTGARRGMDRVTPAARGDSVTRALATHAAAIRQLGGVTRFIPFAADSSQALMVVPRCQAGTCTDLFVGLIDARRLLGAIASDTLQGFEVAIGTRHRWLSASSPLPAGGARAIMEEPIIRGGPDWRIGVWPSLSTALVTPSTLSDVLLLLGIAVSVLLALALRLAQNVSYSARLDERATLDRALQSTTDGLWEWDLHTGIVTRSEQLWRRLGYASGNGHSHMQDWLLLVHPQDRARVEDRLRDHVAGRSDAFDAEYRVRSASGRWHDFIDRGRVVLRTPEGLAMRLLGMFADITDRRHAEEALRQAETMSTMGRLAARIAHEINNPLAGIQSAFLLIKDAIPPTHPHIKYVGAIEREVQRISQVTRQLYETYRPETESSSHAPVQTVVGDAVAFLEQVNRNTGVSVDVELGGVAAVVRLPNSILRQCVYNLVQNAIEASPPGARVMVRGSIEGDEFVLRVSDRGPGVPPELRESIFEPFISTKLSQLSTGGMGLGLALVRRALDAAGGSIELTDAAGGGAEFIARIPLAGSTVPGVTA
ncbi:MAG: PAS domain-containing protein [Gemmatimonadaceae bacterium]|nr:PAS domain-containing protein [Gemmatimonadaceae bacterium]